MFTTILADLSRQCMRQKDEFFQLQRPAPGHASALRRSYADALRLRPPPGRSDDGGGYAAHFVEKQQPPRQRGRLRVPGAAPPPAAGRGFWLAPLPLNAPARRARRPRLRSVGALPALGRRRLVVLVRWFAAACA